MGTKPTDTELGQLARMYGKSWEMLVNGTRTKADLQAFIEGRIVRQEPVLDPAWALSPRKLRDDVFQLNYDRGWGFSPADMPPIPDVRPTKDQALLLAVYLPDKGSVPGILRNYNEHVAVIKNRFDAKRAEFSQRLGATFGPDDLRLQSGEYRPGLRWVLYNYKAHYGGEYAIGDLWSRGVKGLAASEVLSALMLFPDYWRSMRGLHAQAPHPNLAGYKVRRRNGRGTTVPYVVPSTDDGMLLLANESTREVNGASPTITEL